MFGLLFLVLLMVFGRRSARKCLERRSFVKRLMKITFTRFSWTETEKCSHRALTMVKWLWHGDKKKTISFSRRRSSSYTSSSFFLCVFVFLLHLISVGRWWCLASLHAKHSKNIRKIVGQQFGSVVAVAVHDVHCMLRLCGSPCKRRCMRIVRESTNCNHSMAQ